MTLHVLYAYEPVMGRDPFTDRMEHCATWSCDCGASGDGDPYECATCGCDARTVDGPLPGDDEPVFDDRDPYDPYELGRVT